MCGVPRDCGCVHVWVVGVYMCGVLCLGLWVCRCVECLGIVGVYMSGLWVCTCVECIGIVGVYMCGVPRDCECIHVRCLGIVGV